MTAHYDHLECPWGMLAVITDTQSRLLAVSFLNEDHKPGCVQAWDATRESFRRRGYELREDTDVTRPAVEALRAYFRGDLEALDVEVAPHGTQFQLRVWDALREIPAGETRTYSEIAQAIDRPKAARAVGRAVGTNPVSFVIPCHRVVGADGSLTGYAGGLRMKRGLLELEGAAS